MEQRLRNRRNSTRLLAPWASRRRHLFWSGADRSSVPRFRPSRTSLSAHRGRRP